MNPREMQKIMKQMKAQEIAAVEVIIRTKDGELVVENPQVVKMSLMGQETLQITGKLVERAKGPEEGDVKLVMEQAGVGEPEARAALEKTKDIAQAILELKN